MKNIQSKTISSSEVQNFVIFIVRSERQIKGRMLCKPFYCFYNNNNMIDLICLIGWLKFIILLQFIDLVKNQRMSDRKLTNLQVSPSDSLHLQFKLPL